MTHQCSRGGRGGKGRKSVQWNVRTAQEIERLLNYFESQNISYGRLAIKAEHGRERSYGRGGGGGGRQGGKGGEGGRRERRDGDREGRKWTFPCGVKSSFSSKEINETNSMQVISVDFKMKGRQGMLWIEVVIRTLRQSPLQDFTFISDPAQISESMAKCENSTA